MPAKEFQEQIAFVQWFRAQYPKTLIHSIPNGAHLAGDARQRGRQMARLKAEGLVVGIPDLFVPAWRLYIEMKREKGGTLQDEQKAMAEALWEAGCRVIVCRGFEDAKSQITTHIHPRGAP